MMSPCKGCTERAVGCHSGCEAYEEYRKHRDDINARKMRQKETESYYCEKHARVVNWHWNHDNKGGWRDGGSQMD